MERTYTDAEWQAVLDASQQRVNDESNYARACGRMAALMHLPASMCPYGRWDWLRNSWADGYINERRALRMPR